MRREEVVIEATWVWPSGFSRGCESVVVVRATRPESLMVVRRKDWRDLRAGREMVGSGSRESLTRRSTNSCWVNWQTERARPAPSREKKERAMDSEVWERGGEGSGCERLRGVEGDGRVGGVGREELGSELGDGGSSDLVLGSNGELSEDLGSEASGGGVDGVGKGSLGGVGFGLDSGIEELGEDGTEVGFDG